MQELEKSLSLIEGNENNLTVILLGDFNLLDINWSVSPPFALCSVSTHFCDMTGPGVCINKPELLTDIKVGTWSSWKSLFFKAVERNIPSKFISTKRNVPWFNSGLKKLIRKKQRLWK